MITKEIVLGGKKYTLASLPIRHARAWREKLATNLEGVATIIGSLDMDLSKPEAMQTVIAQVRTTVFQSVDTIIDLLFEFSPLLQKDKERIENEVHEDEAVTAFVEVLKLAYPLGSLVQAIKPIVQRVNQNGRSDQRISKK